ncbi:hypothetical protein PV325_008839, partial [Microctonus aethiopoides]
CSECLGNFHPNCYELYLSYRGANSCYFSKLITISPEEMQSMKSASARSTSTFMAMTPIYNAMSAAPQSSTLETALHTFITQQTFFNNHLSEVMKEKSDELNDIKTIAKSVAEQQKKIKKLEQDNAILSKNMADLVQQNEIHLQRGSRFKT